MSKPENLPQVSESQRIGMLAQKCFVANMPIDWAETELGGTEDFGFDYQIQDTREGYARSIFRAQLKGTQHPKLNASGEFYSIKLATSTVNLYQQTNEPVLLILADLTVDPKIPKNCHLYYVWIHEELRRVSLVNSNVTLRVPVTNQLTTESNLSSEVERMLKLGKVGQALDNSMEELRPDLSDDDRATLINNIPANFAARSGCFFEVMTESPEESWPSPKAGTMPWHFKEADHHLKDGDVANAEASLNETEKMLKTAQPLELSDYWHLRGRLFQLKGDEKSARDAYAESAATPNSPPKHIASWAESEIRLNYKENTLPEVPADFSYVLAKLTDTSPMTLGMRARVLAAEGKFTEAMECTNSFQGVESLMAKAIIHCMQSEFEQTLDVCEKGLQQSEAIKYGRQLFLMLRARARFSLALNLASSDHEIQLPPSGPARTNLDLLPGVWEDVLDAITEFQRVGWPPNIDYLADIWSASAIMLGKQKEALPLIKSAGNARPHLSNLQRALELVACHCGDLKLALEANMRLPFDDLTASHHVTLLHNLKRDDECVELFEQLLPRMNTDLPSFGEAAAIASLSAHRIVKTSQRDEWRSILNAREHLKPYAALAEYFATVEDNSLASDVAADKLWDSYESLGQPITIAQQLVGILDPSSPTGAQKCKQVASRLASTSLLNLRTSLVLARAFATLSEWQSLLDLCMDDRRFSDSSHLAAFRALALENLGYTAQALETLKALIAQGVSHPLAINTYINIVVRCGFGQEAVATVSSILSSAETRDQKLDCLRLLFNLVHMADPCDPRAFDFAVRYGSHCDQSDEIEEGIFLSMILRAKLTMAPPPGRIDNDQLNKRYALFFDKFPKSNILRKGEVSENASDEEVMQAIKNVLGHDMFDQGRINHQTKIARELQRGEIPVPYAWRPRNILRNVGDLPLLWEIGKRSKHEERQYQLTMAQHEWEAIPLSDMRKKIPLLDLTALLVTHDLGLFELLFKIFPKIAIAQATVLELAKLATPLAGGGMQEKCATLLRNLRANFERIQQPHAVKPAERTYLHWASEEIKSIVKRGEFQLYSDDLFIRIYCREGCADPSDVCTLDIISALVDLGAISIREAAQKIATLCVWKVAFSIEPRYILYCIPQFVDQAKSPTAATKILRADTNAMTVLNRIWDPAISFDESLSRASILLSHFIQDPNASFNTMTAAMDIWCAKAKLSTDPESSIKNIALVVAGTAMCLVETNTDFFKKLRAVYSALVEMDYGDKMDECSEKDSIVVLGYICSEVDMANGLANNNQLLKKIGSTFTKGTSDEEAFSCGYSNASLDAGLRVIREQ